MAGLWARAMWMARAAALLAAALLVVGGCGEDDAPEVTGERADAGADDSEPAEVIVTPRPGMVDVVPVDIWYEYGTWDEGRMYVMFPSRGAPCEVLDRVEIDETDTSITVTLYQGREPDRDTDEPCDEPVRRHLVAFDVARDPSLEEGGVVNGAETTNRP